MARIPYLEPEDLTPGNRDLLARNINLYKALVHSPDATRSFLELARYIRYHSRLDPRLREMAILQVGYSAKSPYEYSHHIKIGREFGVTDEDIHAIEAETQGKPTDLPPLTRAILRAARELTAQPELSDATFAELREGLDNELNVQLILTNFDLSGLGRIPAALENQRGPHYQHYLQEF